MTHYSLPCRVKHQGRLFAQYVMLVLLVLVAAIASAKGPITGRQLPGAHRMLLGSFEITTLLDGYVEMERKVLAADPQVVDRMLDEGHVPSGPVRLPVNVFLINTGEKLVLVDAGASNGAGAHAGKLPESLALAGVAPSQIDEVVFTHLHRDHLPGLLSPDGAVNFPNANVHVARAEYEYWASPKIAAEAPEARRPYFALAKKVLAAYGKRLKLFKPGASIAPGIRSIDASGHTPGHTCYLIESQGKKLMLVGDIAHVAAVQFREVGVTTSYDVDAQKALAARKRVFEQVARDQIPIAGAHLPFPGIGFARKVGESYAFEGLVWQLF